MDDFVDPPGRYTDVLGQPVLTDLQGEQEFLQQDFPRMNWLYSFHHHIHLMVIDDFNIGRIAVFPAKTNSPLIIDPNTVLTAPICGETFQSISRWDPQISKCIRRIQDQKLSQSYTLNSTESLGISALKDLFSLSAAKSPDH